jgi:hypothetical protein
MAKNNNKTKPPNTLLSSQTTPASRQPCHYTPRHRDGQLARRSAQDRRDSLCSNYSTRSISAPRLTKFSTNSGYPRSM